jgi:hypothetical protein
VTLWILVAALARRGGVVCGLVDEEGAAYFAYSRRGYGRIGTLLPLTFWFWHPAEEGVGP